MARQLAPDWAARQNVPHWSAVAAYLGQQYAIGRRSAGWVWRAMTLWVGRAVDPVLDHFLTEIKAAGRWPANVVHDGSDEVLAAFPDAPGALRGVGPELGADKTQACYGDYGPRPAMAPRGDAGSAARFFYSAKADADDRAGSSHPTIKPLDLMRWLVRLVTPPHGSVIDPFAGSGTTGEAAMLEGFTPTMIELEAAHCADIRRRMGRARGDDTPLFAGKV